MAAEESTGTERESGYCKPPVDKQFKPGNKAAVKRRNGFHLKPLLKKLLKEVATDKNGRPRADGKTYAELLVQSTMLNAMKGNSTAIKEIWDRIEGKVPQAITGEDGGAHHQLR